ncbi:MAG: FtsX-like permease family protein, partial [bacterium]|nr:FtsX-like permease family protein [bacterium]
AIRLALGGGRTGILRQLLTESIALAALGGLTGVGLGYLGIHLIRTFAQETMGIWQTIQLDFRVLLVTMGIALLTAVLFGLFPALQASRHSIKPQLAEGGDRGVAGVRSRWPRRIMVTVQVALSVVLLAGAAVTTRTVIRLWRLDPGFDTTNVVTASLSLHEPRYTDTENVSRLFDQSLERIR